MFLCIVGSLEKPSLPCVVRGAYNIYYLELDTLKIEVIITLLPVQLVNDKLKI